MAFSRIINDYLEIHSGHRFYQGGWEFSINQPTNNNRPLSNSQGIQITENQNIAQQHVLGINLRHAI